jgi:hypothetical protein
MATNEMLQYFRGDGNHSIGVMIAMHNEEDNIVHIGWSKCNKKDKFNKERGIKIARGRALSETKVAVPSSREFVNVITDYIEDANTGNIVEVPMYIVIENLQKQYKTFISRVVTYFKSVEKFTVCGSEVFQLDYANLVEDTRTLDIDRQAIRKANEVK